MWLGHGRRDSKVSIHLCKGGVCERGKRVAGLRSAHVWKDTVGSCKKARREGLETFVCEEVFKLMRGRDNDRCPECELL